MKNYPTFFAAVLLSFGVASCGGPDTTAENETEDVAIDSTADTKTITQDEEISDDDLILYTYMNNEMQAGLARVAQEKAASQSVKDLSQKLVTANKEISSKLDELATAAEVSLPGGLEVEQQTKMDSVQQLAPEEFDQTYVEMLVSQQKDNISMLEDLSARADNPIVRGLASEIIDIQQTQIEESEAVQDEIGS